MQQTVQARAADADQLALPVRETRSRRRPARAQRLTYGEWVRRDARLFAAYRAAQELGDERQISRARAAWKTNLNEMPPTRRRGGGR